MKFSILFSFLLYSALSTAQLHTDAPWMAPFNNPNRTIEPTFQEIVDSFNAYWVGKDETVKGSGYKPFKRWESLYQDYLNPDGRVLSRQQLWDAWQSINQNRSSQSDDSNWVTVGPLSHTNTGSWSSGQGRLNAMEVDPSNPNIWYVGAPSGGIWKSIDAGTSWTPLSDQLPQIGVSGIAIDPTNSDVLYIATGDDDAGDSFSVGVMKSTDGGLTWNTTGLNPGNSPGSMNEIFIDPNDSETLWVATSNGIFKTTNGGNTWINKRSGNFDDLELKPGDASVLYAATGNIVYKSTNGGENWSSITSGVLSGTARLEIDVTPANPDVLYIFTTDFSYGTGKIYKSSNEGASFELTFDGEQDIFETNQAWYDFAFAVSDTNENEIYTGILNIWKSTNSGDTFTQLNNWSAPASASYTHADIHNLRFINGTLFAGTDGGIYTSTDGGTNFTDLTQGLAIGQFYRIDVAKQDPTIIAGGLQDNGGYARLNGQWQNYYGADGMEAAFDPSNPENIFGFIQFGGGPYFSNTGGSSLGGNYLNPAQGLWITPLAFAADERLYAGYSRIYELDRCSGNWMAKSPSFGQTIRNIATDPNNAAIMYVTIDNRLYRSATNGENFTQIDTFPNDITSVEVNNGDSSKVYIVTSGTAGKVYEATINGMNATRTDITGSLPEIPKLVVKHQAYHPDTILYLGTALGVWRYNATLGDWESFQNNLPNTAVRDLDINEGGGILTAGTYGRGIWQTEIELSTPDTDIALLFNGAPSSEALTCGENPLSIILKNNGVTTLTSAMITYGPIEDPTIFNWSGNLATSQEAQVELPVLGLNSGIYNYQIRVSVANDVIPDNNTLSIPYGINREGTFMEINVFEDETSEFLVLSQATANSACGDEEVSTTWERGTPSGTLLNQTTSGNNAYATNLSGNYSNDTLEYLTTPCFDLTAVASPFISFKMAFDLENNWDVVYVQYTTDQGASWDILGTADDANWYNSDTVPGTNCFNCPGAQWTGTDTNMNEYSYDLSAFDNQSSMMFRFVFHSDQSVTREGAVIDDLLLGGETLSIEDAQFTGLQIYPNPSNGLFSLNYNQGEPLSYQVFDILGKEVLTNVILEGTSSEHQIDMQSFSTGMYLLNITQGSKQIVKKLIIN